MLKYYSEPVPSDPQHKLKFCVRFVAIIATKSNKNISNKFQGFSNQCDKPISNVAVVDRNQLCVLEKYDRKYLQHILVQYYNDRPFAAGGHMVQNPKYWRAK